LAQPDSDAATDNETDHRKARNNEITVSQIVARTAVRTAISPTDCETVGQN